MRGSFKISALFIGGSIVEKKNWLFILNRADVFLLHIFCQFMLFVVRQAVVFWPCCRNSCLGLPIIKAFIVGHDFEVVRTFYCWSRF